MDLLCSNILILVMLNRLFKSVFNYCALPPTNNVTLATVSSEFMFCYEENCIAMTSKVRDSGSRLSIRDHASGLLHLLHQGFKLVLAVLRHLTPP